MRYGCTWARERQCLGHVKVDEEGLKVRTSIVTDPRESAEKVDPWGEIRTS